MPQLLDKTIEILSHRHLRGPNMWSYNPALEVLIDIGDLEDYPSDLIPGFYDRLSKCLPSLHEHRCSYGEPGGFLKRVEEGTWPGHILEHLTIELQNLAGIAGGFGRARDGGRRGVYKVIVSATEEAVTLQAFKFARDLLLTLIQDNGDAVAQREKIIEELRDLSDDLCLGPSTACIVNAATAREIPYIRLSSGNLVQLGYGSKQRRIWTAETDQTSAIAETISRDKDLTKSLLASAGVPTPEGRTVSSPDDAWEAAQDIGLPVVVKPIDGNHGRGVFINLYTQQEIEAAYAVAIEEGSEVLVERHIIGDEHRLLVVGNKVVAAAKGETVWITGDGKHSVLELIQIQINSDPRRGTTEECPLNPVRIDSAVELELARQKLAGDSIPSIDQKVLIQSNGNVAFDVTDLVHPEVAHQVALAARVVGLEIAGVDLVAQDISKPLESQNAAIVEVNAGPGLLMHLKPASGKPQPVGEEIANHLFPPGYDFRIPIVGISGNAGRTVVAEMVAHFIRLTNMHVGLSTNNGLYFGSRTIKQNSSSHWENARRTLQNRAIEVAVIENDNASLLLEGLAYDQCQVGIVLNIDPLKLFPEHNITEEDQLFNVVRTQVDVVLPTGTSVLNADVAIIVKMAELSKGEVMYFSQDPNSSVITAHQEKDGRSIIVSPSVITLKQGKLDALVIPIPPAVQGSSLDWAPNLSLAAAIGAAWALDIPFNVIEAGVETFVSNSNIAAGT
ncbi:MAG: cyanophycin synthetase [Polynucleobacter sp. 24-46-87]|jgi:cyanophycin synthetase|uniref:cyanophycin synthetase n=1 Tax=unclassified Polynucleobacter TaxID=2640945 RepID=UPI000BCC436E|nr:MULTISPECIES: cyanophycin synthetase [unclassified Polynucleobacter]OYY19391.1 MAG: cyanophycin synthetase [Polynucleobacter sp. 35-46-11]OZA15658.1 MAG: cyanophycin synthetase [Polynucleobacter sp. 24-46-87]OZA77484.1 MAG: cyanophycin synthetase [Polynucleobacter sp. 39-46-10]